MIAVIFEAWPHEEQYQRYLIAGAHPHQGVHQPAR